MECVATNDRIKCADDDRYNSPVMSSAEGHIWVPPKLNALKPWRIALDSPG